ncbi:MAG: uroporphyrinogen-III synthase [Parvularculaceae bacterium]
MSIVLVTRPSPDGETFAEDCRAAGLTAVLAPVMRIDIDNTSIDLSGVGALAFTSANGVRAYAANIARRDLPAYAVGAVTAAAAHEAGFGDVRVADGDVSSLADHIAGEKAELHGALLHLAGETVAGDLVAMLTARGVAARRASLYRAEALDALPDAALTALAREAGWVSLFSPRTARLFRTLAAGADLSRWRAACLSDAVAAASGDGWAGVSVAARPDAAGMIALMTGRGA